jgi:hypothetical protein
MFLVGSVAGRGQIDIGVLPLSMEVKVYLLLSRRGVTLCVLCCFLGCLPRGWCIFGSLVVSFYSVGKCASTVQIIRGIIVMYKEFCVMVLTYGNILSCFWCPAVPAVVRMWRNLCYLWVLIC